MIRLVNITLVLLSISLFGALYHIRYSADAEARSLQKLDFKYVDALREQQVLRAEWASLNDPARLQDLSQTYLGLVYASSNQLIEATKWREHYVSTTGPVLTAEAQ